MVMCTFQKAVDHLVDAIQERRASAGEKEHQVESSAYRVGEPVEVRDRQIAFTYIVLLVFELGSPLKIFRCDNTYEFSVVIINCVHVVKYFLSPNCQLHGSTWIHGGSPMDQRNSTVDRRGIGNLRECRKWCGQFSTSSKPWFLFAANLQ